MNTEHKSNTPEEVKDLYQTPPELYNTLNSEFNFILDVAATKDNTLAPLYYDESLDALSRSWGNTVCWCNPPYSNIMPWVKKAAEESRCNATVVMLVPSDTSVKWFKEAWSTATEMRFISGRISFISSVTGLPVKGNNKGSVLIIWRPGQRYLSSSMVNLVLREDLVK